MPYLQLITNVDHAEPKDFTKRFSKFGADVLNKPEQYISCSITHNETLTFNGTHDPAFQLTIISLDNLNEQANELYSKAFSEFFEQELNIPNNRGYITFIDPGRANIGFEGTTFATIFKRMGI